VVIVASAAVLAFRNWVNPPLFMMVAVPAVPFKNMVDPPEVLVISAAPAVVLESAK
jgi:hypothetical protein